ncbi:helix-turn-helix transcriptional regulator [Pseudoroseicyclus aestuarii]|uniref:Regulatory LuxR family protein n=1 Tax=Pseudoroseicyclus aestuarii TaxID=1795041 RepID=A0A318SPP2_9RHOB|nr:LuxR family transcriptional regulator [Pseudoroseicyclus aestuarii]PYE82565.1 regulatory LuxR family protein [Pseudoroseicyclus aestuarii]
MPQSQPEPAGGRDAMARVLGQPLPLVLLRAPAGMGKSHLLRRLARHLGCDVAGRLPEGRVEGPCLIDLQAQEGVLRLPPLGPGARLIVAHRPGLVLRGAERLLAQGEALRLGPEALRGAEDADGGWPVLAHLPEEEARTTYIREEVLDPLPPARLAALHLALSYGQPCDPPPDRDLPALRQEGGRPRVVPESLRPTLERAFAAALARRLPQEGAALTAGYAAAPAGAAAAALLDLGAPEAALRQFEAAQGWYAIYRIGPEAFSRLLDRFPAALRQASPALVLADAIRALKQGEVEWARNRIATHFGREALNIRRVISRAADHGPGFRIFSVTMLIYQDIAVPPALTDQLYTLLDDLPLSDELHRGTFYNAMVEFLTRQRRHDEALVAAGRALRHYEAAEVPHLAFYVCLHQAGLYLTLGEVGRAEAALHRAQVLLDRCGFDSPGDARLLRLLVACTAYEQGDSGPLIAFWGEDSDPFARGEIWPTLLETALHYGGQVLAEQYSLRTAASFLDRWGVVRARNRQFRFMIEMRRAQIQQTGQRWTEAARTAAQLQSRLDRVWVETAGEELARLAGREEVQLALFWLRQIVHETPRRAHLDGQLRTMAQNPALTGRQARSLRIWRAHVARERGDLSLARGLVREILVQAAETRSLAPLSEEAAFLIPLIEDRRIGDYVRAAGPARAVLRRLQDSRAGAAGAAARGTLTRREARILTLLAEGASNKLIGRQLGIAEGTVKFHVTNLLRKMGCANRGEAIAAGQALGWLG